MDFPSLLGLRRVWVYAQTEVVQDLIALRLADSAPMLFNAPVRSVEGVTGDRCVTAYTHNGMPKRLTCDFVVGADGYHAVVRHAVLSTARRTHERTYPYFWLGVLAEAPPASQELIYAHSHRGFAPASMKSSTASRLYLQVPNGEDPAAWPDKRIWDELDTRLAVDESWQLNRGPITAKAVLPMRSWVTEPLRYGRVLFAGDAARTVPPTGAKGLNLAASEVTALAAALSSCYATGASDLLDAYSDTCLQRVWRAEHFSYLMTTTMHIAPGLSTRDSAVAVPTGPMGNLDDRRRGARRQLRWPPGFRSGSPSRPSRRPAVSDRHTSAPGRGWPARKSSADAGPPLVPHCSLRLVVSGRRRAWTPTTRSFWLARSSGSASWPDPTGNLHPASRTTSRCSPSNVIACEPSPPRSVHCEGVCAGASSPARKRTPTHAAELWSTRSGLRRPTSSEWRPRCLSGNGEKPPRRCSSHSGRAVVKMEPYQVTRVTTAVAQHLLDSPFSLLPFGRPSSRIGHDADRGHTGTATRAPGLSGESLSVEVRGADRARTDTGHSVQPDVVGAMHGSGVAVPASPGGRHWAQQYRCPFANRR
ncbi:4-hydroxybenzoate 3-monooxygenase [Streptomyces zagrosensis]|uniref:4-hydroxybenzoate 3-monooxygenase n=1 Tax=Streptomyces zagrosensis TaxID=1042984 RepID=A0A7W9QEN7_9ACTN|nr:4-hydroxybenzoate 3-monooxygenase [Streptomyces zagrosensis]